MSVNENIAWVRVAKRSDLAAGEAIAVKVVGTEIAICDLNSSVHAFDNICTHEYACLSDGFIEGDEIECPLHQARFHIPTGKALTLPACIDLRVYPVKIEGEDVYVGHIESANQAGRTQK
jgi:nitrite reductase/ring-hydroxylating ferredoxin subunit